MIAYFATMEDCVIQVTERGDGHRLERHLEGTSPLCVTSSPATPEHSYVGTLNDGVFRSLDRGSSWECVGDGIESRRITALAVDIDGRVWAGTEPSAIYRSDDGGATWEAKPGVAELPSASEWSYPPRPETHNVRWIEPDPLDSEQVYVCIEQGALVRTTDGGQTWNDRVPQAPRDVHMLRTHPEAPSRLYAATGDGAEEPGKGYAESHDRGETWRYPNEELDRQYLTSVAVDAVDPQSVLVSASTVPKHDDFDTLSSGVYRRTGDGSWENCTSGLPDEVGLTPPTLAASDREPGRFFAAANRGLFRTDDYGDSWEEIDVRWPEAFESQHPRSVTVVE